MIFSDHTHLLFFTNFPLKLGTGSSRPPLRNHDLVTTLVKKSHGLSEVTLYVESNLSSSDTASSSECVLGLLEGGVKQLPIEISESTEGEAVESE